MSLSLIRPKIVWFRKKLISQIWRRLRKKIPPSVYKKSKNPSIQVEDNSILNRMYGRDFWNFVNWRRYFFYDAFFVGLHLHIWQKSSYIEDCISKNSNLILTSWVLNERSYSLWREMNLKTTLLYDFQVILAFGKSKTCFICEKLMHFHTWNLFLKKS